MLITGHTLVPNDLIEYVMADEASLLTTRKAIQTIAERNAVLRLVAVAETIAESMSKSDQPAMYKRLKGALADLRSFGLEG